MRVRPPTLGPLLRAAQAVLVAIGLCYPMAAYAQAGGEENPFFRDWQARATAIQAEQPNWITPLITTTARLEQEFRSDFVWRTAANGRPTSIIFNGKGLELIPARPLEVIIGVPSYVFHHNPRESGWGDWPLLLKYRFASENVAQGNYIFTGFLGATVPTGGKTNGAGVPVITPTLAGGKGWGQLDLQGTFGVNIPAGNASKIGNPLLYNGVLQYHVDRFLWPEIELNGTSWTNGTNSGKTQLFLTPAILFGRIPLNGRLGITVGAGVQIAVTSFFQYNHAYTLSFRLPF